MVANSTGWTELIDGRIFDASIALYTLYFGDWFFTLLFIAFKILLWFGTKSVATGFIASMIFLVVFYSTLESTIVGTMVAIATFELAILIYTVIFKK